MKKIIGWLAVIIWIIIIFSFSSQVAEQSNNLSTNVTEVVVETVEKVIPNKEFDVKTINHYIRKNAHFIVYMILGLLLMNAMNAHSYLLKTNVIIVIFLGALTASLDEFYQSFIPGRGPGIKDVFIDTSGLLLGIIMYISLIKYFKKSRRSF